MSNPLLPKADSELDATILNEVQVLLSEKRTALSTMRTGIAVFAFPLSVLSILIATSRMYQLQEVMQWLVPLLLLNLGLTGLGVYLIARAFRRIHHYDRLIDGFKRKHSKLAELLD
jgi:drug/metabolite transporter (DMT)-like permease